MLGLCWVRSAHFYWVKTTLASLFSSWPSSASECRQVWTFTLRSYFQTSCNSYGQQVDTVTEAATARTVLQIKPTAHKWSVLRVILACDLGHLQAPVFIVKTCIRMHGGKYINALTDSLTAHLSCSRTLSSTIHTPLCSSTRELSKRALAMSDWHSSWTLSFCGAFT